MVKIVSVAPRPALNARATTERKLIDRGRPADGHAETIITILNSHRDGARGQVRQVRGSRPQRSLLLPVVPGIPGSGSSGAESFPRFSEPLILRFRTPARLN